MTFETPRLLLEPLKPTDAEDYYAVVSDPDVRRFASVKKQLATVEQYRTWINERPPCETFATRLRDSNAFIGYCGFREIDDEVREYAQFQDGMTEITIQLLPKYRRKNFGREIVQVLLDVARKNHKKVIGIPHPDNTDSISFLTQIGWRELLHISDQCNSKYGYTIYAPKNQD